MVGKGAKANVMAVMDSSSSEDSILVLTSWDDRHPSFLPAMHLVELDDSLSTIFKVTGFSDLWNAGMQKSMKMTEPVKKVIVDPSTDSPPSKDEVSDTAG